MNESNTHGLHSIKELLEIMYPEIIEKIKEYGKNKDDKT